VHKSSASSRDRDPTRFKVASYHHGTAVLLLLVALVFATISTSLVHQFAMTMSLVNFGQR
jgi:hypothetical protein